MDYYYYLSALLSRLPNTSERLKESHATPPDERSQRGKPSYIIPREFFFVHPVAKQTVQRQQKVNGQSLAKFRLDGCCFLYLKLLSY